MSEKSVGSLRHSLCFIGAGNMAEAIARGIITAGIVPPAQIAAIDPSGERLDIFERQLHIQRGPDAALSAARADCVILAGEFTANCTRRPKRRRAEWPT